MAAHKITEDTSVAEIVKSCPGARRIFDEHGLKRMRWREWSP